MGAKNTPLHEVAAKADLHGLGFDPFRVSAGASAPLQTLLSRGRASPGLHFTQEVSVLQQGYPPDCLVFPLLRPSWQLQCRSSHPAWLLHACF